MNPAEQLARYEQAMRESQHRRTAPPKPASPPAEPAPAEPMPAKLPPQTWEPAMTLMEARRRLQRERDEGLRCPCCDQYAKVYRRTINSGMARSLGAMFRAAELGWQHVPTSIGRRSAEEGKLAYWGLVEEERSTRPDGGRAGFWRVTAKGEEFLRGRILLPKYARVYDGVCLGHEGILISIHDAFGSPFSLAELLAS